MNKKINYANLFFIAVIVFGLISIFILSLKLIKKDEEKVTTTTTKTTTTKVKTNNKGMFRTYASPASVGETVLASFNDEYDVDITGVRFIDNDEASTLLTDPLKEGFKYEGFVYDVTFNDLDYLTEPIAPLLNVEIYNDTGSNFITFNGHNHVIKIVTLNDYKMIKNSETSRVTIVYQVPIDKYHIVCLGIREKKLSCFQNHDLLS